MTGTVLIISSTESLPEATESHTIIIPTLQSGNWPEREPVICPGYLAAISLRQSDTTLEALNYSAINVT